MHSVATRVSVLKHFPALVLMGTVRAFPYPSVNKYKLYTYTRLCFEGAVKMQGGRI